MISDFGSRIPTFHTKIVCVWIVTSISQQLDPSNVSSWVWWMASQGWDWSSFTETVTAGQFLSDGWGWFLLQDPHFSHQDCVEIGVYSLELSLQAGFSVTGGDDFWFRLQDPHSLPMSHHEYDEWQDKDEIGAHSLKLSRMILAPGSPHFTPRLCVFWLPCQRPNICSC